MSNPSPPICLRIPPLLLAAIDAEIKRRNETPLDQPWNRSTFLLYAASLYLDLTAPKQSEPTPVKPTKAKHAVPRKVGKRSRKSK
jgi:hypothetical protein